MLGVVAIAGAFAWAIWRGALPRRWLAYLLAGGLVGLSWELAFTFGGMGYPILPGGAANPQGMDIDQLPLPAIAVMVVLVCVWDGALFVCGLLLARALLGARVERRFSWPALLVMLTWGQLTSFVIEIYAIENGLWAYGATWWNPKLFDWGAAQVTLVPQAVWLASVPLFYAAVLRISPPVSAPEPPAAS